MSRRVCHAVTVVAIVVVVLAAACRASSPCSPPPPGCSPWGRDTPVQVPVEVDLCVAGEASAVLAFQDHDGNDVCSLTVARGAVLEARDGRGQLKDTRPVPEAALRGRRLHLKMQYSGNDLRVLTQDDAALVDTPVGGTDSLRVILTQQDQSHDAAICTEPTGSSPPIRNDTTAEPAPDPASDAPKEEEEEEEKIVVLLVVGTGLVGVAVTLSLGMLGLTLAFP